MLGRKWQEGGVCAPVVAQHVLHRLLGGIQVVSAIFMVMMTFILPVKCRVLKIGHQVHRRTDARKRNGLPKHGKEYDEDGQSAHSVPSIASAIVLELGIGYFEFSRQVLPQGYCAVAKACSSRGADAAF
jgi:hypothetical protein